MPSIGYRGLPAWTFKSDAASNQLRLIYRNRERLVLLLIGSSFCGGTARDFVCSKILERGYFPWPTAKEGVAHLTQAQLSMLVEGIDWRRPAWTSAPARTG